MTDEFRKKLLALNCAYNFKEEYRNLPACHNERRCFSTTCLMNVDHGVSDEIQERGCIIYRLDFVQEVIARKK